MLQMQAISKRFGATAALREVSLEARAGEVLALVGENGAGKSTLMKILSGAHAPDSGRMQLGDRPYAPGGPQDARSAGVAMIYQELTLAPHLSVEDNIMLGQEERSYGLLSRKRQRPRVRTALALLGHPDLKPETPVGQLSVGAQQLVEIARALVMQARVVVFDEPTSALTRADVEHLFRAIRRLRESGAAIIYISHFLEEVREICDRYTVLRDGRSVGSGDLAGASEAQIVSLMVGRSVDELFPAVPHTPGAPLLDVSALAGMRAPREVSLSLRRGEILGIAGLIGSGRTEFLRTLLGLDPVRRGEVRIAGKFAAPRVAARMRSGLALVSEDRKGEGLALGLSIADNATLSHLTPYKRAGWLRLGARRRAVAGLMQQFQVKAASPEQRVAELSGGNQQKVALARVAHQGADILLLDEPTRGIDVGTKAEIYRRMGQWAAEGKAIVFVSSYLPELLAVCDRIGVMNRGRLREIRPADQWSEESIMACAVAGEGSA
ncbi:MAG: sugar ABC transporter ATP-binding protein [Pirellulales bacterium]